MMRDPGEPDYRTRETARRRTRGAGCSLRCRRHQTSSAQTRRKTRTTVTSAWAQPTRPVKTPTNAVFCDEQVSSQRRGAPCQKRRRGQHSLRCSRRRSRGGARARANAQLSMRPPASAPSAPVGTRTRIPCRHQHRRRGRPPHRSPAPESRAAQRSQGPRPAEAATQCSGEQPGRDRRADETLSVRRNALGKRNGSSRVSFGTPAPPSSWPPSPAAPRTLPSRGGCKESSLV